MKQYFPEYHAIWNDIRKVYLVDIMLHGMIPRNCTFQFFSIIFSMLQISQEIYSQFYLLLDNRNIPKSEHNNFRKWLRYYLDFCKKYRFDGSKKERLPHFIKKLQEKHQSVNQQNQASCAISLYYSLSQSVFKNILPDLNERLSDEDKPLIKQIQSSGYVQNNNSKGQVNSDNLERTVTFEKAKDSRKNQDSHSTTYCFSNSQPNFSDLNYSVNENIPDLTKIYPRKINL